MKVKANNMFITIKNYYEKTTELKDEIRSAIRFNFAGGVTAAELEALRSGNYEIIDDYDNVVAAYKGYDVSGELNLIVNKIVNKEQEREELAAALAVEETKKPYIETLTAAIDDAVASTVIPLFPAMKYTGNLIKAGTRINWNGVLKRAAVDLWDRADCDPDHAPDMWEDILYRDGYRIIPDVITVGKAFAYGERGWWKDGLLYESIVNDNVYTPEEYAGNWKIVEEGI